jgi:hypothetical protein
MPPPRLRSIDSEGEGAERRVYDVDGETIVAVLHGGSLLRIERDVSDAEVSLSWSVDSDREL